MFDAPVRKWIDPVLERFARILAKCGLSANLVTIGGFVIGMGGCLAIVYRHYLLALVLIACNRIADGLDGSLARRTGATDLGGFLDIVLDTVFYSAVPFAFAIAHPEYWLPAMFLIYSFVGTGGSFLAFAIIAEKRKHTSPIQQKKSFFYSVGLMEGTETILFFVLFCIFPAEFSTLAWVFGSLCWLTTILRILNGWRTFRISSEGN